MVRDDGAWLVAWLRCVPVFDLVVETRLQRCAELKVLRSLFDVFGPVLVTKTNQPFPVFRGAAYFFAKTLVSTCSTIWMMLLLRKGDRAMISEAAARPIAIIAVVAGSIVVKYPQIYSIDAALKLLAVFRDRQAFLYGLSAMR